MEPIIVRLEPDGETVFDHPHDGGEEFGYVLKGQIFLHMGGAKKMRVRTGESFYFAAKAGHFISNAGGKRTASVLWVSTPPSF